MKHTRALAIVALVALFSLLSLGVTQQLFSSWDFGATTWLHQALPHLLDSPFSAQTLLGSAELTTIIVLLVAFLLYPVVPRIQLLAAFGVIAAIELAGKLWIYQPGPPSSLSRYVRLFPLVSSRLQTPYSFPSGHAGRTTLLTLVIAAWIIRSEMQPAAKRILLALLVVFEVAMLVGLIDLGSHWLTDVAGGVFLGVAGALPVIHRATGRVYPISIGPFTFPPHSRMRSSSPPRKES